MSQFFDDQSKVGASKPTSRAQVRANRRNAKHSTGPRTVEGKRRSSLNAATHGVFCKSPVLPGERDSEYIAFRNLLLDSPGMKPQSWLELSLADQFVIAKWRIRRLGGVEAMTHQSIADDLAEVAAMRREDIERVLEKREAYLAMREAGLASRGDEEEDEEEVEDEHEHEEEEEKEDEDNDDADDDQQALRDTFVRMHAEQRVPASVTMMTSFTTKGDHNGAFERIDRLRHRLELSAHRALRELRQLRKDLGVDVSALETCPFLEEIPEDEEDVEEDVEELDASDMHAEACTPSGAAPDDEVRRGMVTSVTMSSSSGDTSDRASNESAQNEQNEPNSDETRAGDASQGTCEQGSRRIEPFAPKRLAPRGALEPSTDGKEAPHQT